MESEKVYIELLLIKAQNGDHHVWDDLLTIVRGKVKAFAIKILGHSHAIDDCVQESLLTIFKDIKKLKDVKAFHTWLYRVVYSKCMDYGRKHSQTEESSRESNDYMTSLEHSLDIKTAISTLPKTQQTIIFLFYYEGFIITDIANILDKPAGTVKYLLFTAREQLKNHLNTSKQPENNYEY